MSQSHKHSFYESLVNVMLGNVVAISSQLLIFHIAKLNVPLSINMAISVWLTIAAIARSYLVRRYFNRLKGSL